MSVTYPQYALSFPSEKEPAAFLPLLELCQMPKLLLPLPARDTTDGEQQAHPALSVETYDTVTRGQKLTDGEQPLYAPVTGIIAGQKTLTHPLFGDTEYVELDALTLTEEEPAPTDVFTLSSEDILEACRNAAIVDELDGTLLYDKLQALAENPPALLVADAVNDQPYGSAGIATLRAYGSLCADGLMLAAKAVGAAEYTVLLRADRPTFKEIEALLPKGRLTADRRDVYPHRTVFKKRADVCIGIQACLALYRACAFGERHGRLIVTVAGDAVSLPSNVIVPNGTPLSEVFSLCGLIEEPAYYVLGDSFTGVAVESDELPVLFPVTCVLAMKKPKETAAHACIGCGRCAAVCHKHLLPYEIGRRVENRQFRMLPYLSPRDCDGCNACSVVCPANRPVADLVRQGTEESLRVMLHWGVHDYE